MLRLQTSAGHQAVGPQDPISARVGGHAGSHGRLPFLTVFVRMNLHMIHAPGFKQASFRTSYKARLCRAQEGWEKSTVPYEVLWQCQSLPSTGSGLSSSPFLMRQLDLLVLQANSAYNLWLHCRPKCPNLVLCNVCNGEPFTLSFAAFTYWWIIFKKKIFFGGGNLTSFILQLEIRSKARASSPGSGVVYEKLRETVS